MPQSHPNPPEAAASLLKASRSATQPSVWLVDRGGERVVIKTFRDSPPLAQATICRWITRREARNLMTLEGIRGVPRFLGCPDPVTIEMTFLDAHEMHQDSEDGRVDNAFFEDLKKLVKQIHRRGLNHGDIRRKNILREKGTGRPCLVDFAQSMNRRSPLALIARAFSSAARRIDRITVVKLKRDFLGSHSLTPKEREMLESVPLHLRLGRFLKKKVYRPLKHMKAGTWKERKAKDERRRRKREKQDGVA